MNYVLCGAYKAVLFALYLKNVLGKKITIVTFNKDIIDYCKSEDIKYIQFKYIRPTILSLYKFFTLKKMLDNVVTSINIDKNDSIFLLENVKGYDFFYLAKVFAKKNNVYYKNTSKDISIYKPPTYKPFFLRGSIIRTCLKFVMGLDLIYYRTDPNSPCFGIDENFLKRHNIKEYVPDYDVENLIFEAIKKNKLKYGEYDNLIIDHDPLFSQVKLESIKKFYEKLFDLPIKFVYKKHPNLTKEMESYYELFKNCKEIPKYIPAELFYNNVKNSVISLYSTALIYFSKRPNMKAISPLELVEWHDESYKEELKNFLKKLSNNRIIFPRSIEELEEIILN